MKAIKYTWYNCENRLVLVQRNSKVYKFTDRSGSVNLDTLGF